MKQTNSSSSSKRSPCSSWPADKVEKQVKTLRNLSITFQYNFVWLCSRKMTCRHFQWLHVFRLMPNICQLYCIQSNVLCLLWRNIVHRIAMLKFIKIRNCRNYNVSIPRIWSNNNIMRVLYHKNEVLDLKCLR